jgi:hypothetical protein
MVYDSNIHNILNVFMKNTNFNYTSLNQKCRFALNQSMANDAMHISFKCFLHEFRLDVVFRLRCVYFIFVTLLTVGLNLFVIVTNARKLRKFMFENGEKIMRCSSSILYYKTNMTFMSNAVADLTTGLLIMTFTYVSILFEFERWPFSVETCFLWILLNFSCGSCSLLHMLILAHDRLMSLKYPYQSKNLQISFSNLSAMKSEMWLHFFKLVSAWIFSVLLWILLTSVAFKKIHLDNKQYTCELHELDGFIILPHSIIVYFLPILLIISFYALSYYHLHVNLKSLITSKQTCMKDKQLFGRLHRNLTDPIIRHASDKIKPPFKCYSYLKNPNATKEAKTDKEVEFTISTSFGALTHTGNTGEPYQDSTRSMSLHAKRYTKSIAHSEIRVLKRLVFITLVFLVCWLPWCIIWNYQAFNGAHSIKGEVYEVAVLLAHANSFVNPLVIIFTNAKYRRKFKSVFGNLGRHNKRANTI